MIFDQPDLEYEDFVGLKIEEKEVGEYECPEFILSDKEERRIAKS